MIARSYRNVRDPCPYSPPKQIMYAFQILYSYFIQFHYLAHVVVYFSGISGHQFSGKKNSRHCHTVVSTDPELPRDNPSLDLPGQGPDYRKINATDISRTTARRCWAHTHAHLSYILSHPILSLGTMAEVVATWPWRGRLDRWPPLWPFAWPQLQPVGSQHGVWQRGF